MYAFLMRVHAKNQVKFLMSLTNIKVPYCFLVFFMYLLVFLGEEMGLLIFLDGNGPKYQDTKSYATLTT